MGCGSSTETKETLCLPQHDDDASKKARQDRLATVREAFKMDVHDGYPNWVASLPTEKELTPKGVVEISKIFYRLIEAKVDIKVDMCMAKLEKDPALKRPYGRFEAMFDDDDPVPAVAQTWKTDEEFGHQHFDGLLPQFITGIDAVPSNFAVDEGDLPLPDGSTLSDLAATKRLFLSDVCECLEGVEGVDGNVMTVPMILFYLDSRDKLMPLAIALDRAGGRVYTPKKDTPAVWLAAKVHAMCAEFQVHTILIHAVTQHMLIECVWATCNQTVSERHPLYQLLEPHMFNMLFINTNLHDSLTEEPDSAGTKGALAANLQPGREGCVQIMKNAFQSAECDWEAHYNYPARTARRGLSDLPNYLHRDDCTALWNALHMYTKNFCAALYSKPEILSQDAELQAWAEALRDPTRGNLRQLPFDGRIESLDQLTLFLTEVIFQASVCHSHVENCAVEYYHWVPLFPGSCKIPVPISDDITDEDIDRGLPPEPRAVSQAALIRSVTVNPDETSMPRIREFADDHLRNAPKGCRESLDEFLKNLETIETDMVKRHAARRDPANPVPTTFCLPSRLAQSIWQ